MNAIRWNPKRSWHLAISGTWLRTDAKTLCGRLVPQRLPIEARPTFPESQKTCETCSTRATRRGLTFGPVAFPETPVSPV